MAAGGGPYPSSTTANSELGLGAVVVGSPRPPPVGGCAAGVAAVPLVALTTPRSIVLFGGLPAVPPLGLSAPAPPIALLGGSPQTPRDSTAHCGGGPMMVPRLPDFSSLWREARTPRETQHDQTEQQLQQQQQLQQPQQAAGSGSVWEKYEREGPLLGQGNYGTVYLARRKASQSKVAIKTARPGTNAGDALNYEFSMLQLLRPGHQNIVEAYDYYPAEGALVMEFCPGGTLRDHMVKVSSAGRRLPEDDVRKITRQVLQALSYCYDRQLSHGDLKEENIMLLSTDTGIRGGGAAAGGAGEEEEFPRVKLIDFGLVSCGGGTPPYMAPEVWEWRLGAAGPPEWANAARADMWSLGVVLYRLLALPPFAAPPFWSSDNPKEMVEYWKRSPVADFTALRPCSLEAEGLCQRLLQQNVALRPRAANCLHDPWLLMALPPQPAVYTTLDMRPAPGTPRPRAPGLVPRLTPPAPREEDDSKRQQQPAVYQARDSGLILPRPAAQGVVGPRLIPPAPRGEDDPMLQQQPAVVSRTAMAAGLMEPAAAQEQHVPPPPEESVRGGRRRGCSPKQAPSGGGPGTPRANLQRVQQARAESPPCSDQDSCSPERGRSDDDARAGAETEAREQLSFPPRGPTALAERSDYSSESFQNLLWRRVGLEVRQLEGRTAVRRWERRSQQPAFPPPPGFSAAFGAELSLLREDFARQRPPATATPLRQLQMQRRSGPQTPRRAPPSVVLPNWGCVQQTVAEIWQQLMGETPQPPRNPRLIGQHAARSGYCCAISVDDAASSAVSGSSLLSSPQEQQQQHLRPCLLRGCFCATDSVNSSCSLATDGAKASAAVPSWVAPEQLLPGKEEAAGSRGAARFSQRRRLSVLPELAAAGVGVVAACDVVAAAALPGARCAAALQGGAAGDDFYGDDEQPRTSLRRGGAAAGQPGVSSHQQQPGGGKAASAAGPTAASWPVQDQEQLVAELRRLHAEITQLQLGPRTWSRQEQLVAELWRLQAEVAQLLAATRQQGGGMVVPTPAPPLPTAAPPRLAPPTVAAAPRLAPPTPAAAPRLQGPWDTPIPEERTVFQVGQPPTPEASLSLFSSSNCPTLSPNEEEPHAEAASPTSPDSPCPRRIAPTVPDSLGHERQDHL